MSRRVLEITPELVLRAYRHGLFPMAETRHGGRLFWLDPERRGVLAAGSLPPAPGACCARSCRTPSRSHADLDFPATIAGCATAQPGRVDTWISPQIEGPVYRIAPHGLRALGRMPARWGNWSADSTAWQSAACSSARACSALRATPPRPRWSTLWRVCAWAEFHLLDTQFVTEHLSQFGAEEIPRQAYRERLIAGLEAPARWLPAPPPQALEAEFRALAGQLRT